MKNLVNLFSLMICILILTGCSKKEEVVTPVKPDKSKLYLRDQFNERGIWGCGIPCPGAEIPPIETVCNKPNGMCMFAETMPPVELEEFVDLDIDSDYFVLELLSDRVIRLSGLNAKLWDEASVQQTVLSDIGNEYEQYLQEIVQYIRKHVNIPKDLPFSTADSKTILDNYNKKGSQITVLEGEYELKSSEDYDNGYFDLNIIIK